MIRGPRDLIVFDWDGTVVDSILTIARAIQSSARDLGLAVPTDAQARHVIGLGLNDALRMAVPDLLPSRVDAFVARYRFHFFGRGSADVPFAGIEALLGALRTAGLQLAVATGKSRAGLDRALAETGLAPYFSATRCADQGHPKPHPWMLASLSDELGVGPDRMLMIGDTSHDIEMARAFGAASIGVVYGAHPLASLQDAGPDGIADSVPALAALLGVPT